MFSLDDFYYVLYKNLLEPYGLTDVSFYPYGSTDPTDLNSRFSPKVSRYRHYKIDNYVLFYDQEPLFKKGSEPIFDKYFLNIFKTSKKFNILATSEHSREKQMIVQENMLYDWYYFFHGFASLEWYKMYRHLPVIEKSFTKVFISLNRLMTKDRSYRLNLVANYIDKGILDKGLVSLQLADEYGTWRDELFYQDSLLSVNAKKLIYKHIGPLSSPLIVDHKTPQGILSAEADIELQQTALWNVVSETVFYHDKLHLTEKIFKPIVARRPFILVGAPGNLAYLKRYGFKTFDQWIDESYDNIQDPDQRIAAITNELTKLCAMSPAQLQEMHNEMKEILDYNFNHFYTTFKVQIVHELVDNFEHCVNQFNHGKFGDKRFEYSVDFNEVKKRMLL